MSKEVELIFKCTHCNNLYKRQRKVEPELNKAKYILVHSTFKCDDCYFEKIEDAIADAKRWKKCAEALVNIISRLRRFAWRVAEDKTPIGQNLFDLARDGMEVYSLTLNNEDFDPAKYYLNKNER